MENKNPDDLIKEISNHLGQYFDQYIGGPIAKPNLDYLESIVIRNTFTHLFDDYRCNELLLNRIILVTDKPNEELYYIALGLPEANKCYEVYHNYKYIGLVSRTKLKVREHVISWDINFIPNTE